MFKGADLFIANQILIREVGRHLPLCEDWPPEAIDRLRHAVMKLSGGRLRGLRDAVRLAKEDWRDLLMAAGFADDIHAHLLWEPKPPDYR